MTEISRDEWLAALNEISPVPSDDPCVLSVQELCVMFGMGRDATTRRIRKLVEIGRAEQVVKLVSRTDGRRVCATAYRLLKP